MTGALGYVTGSYGSYSNYGFQSKKTSAASFADTIDDTEKSSDRVSQRGSVMAEYYERNPQYRVVQEKRVSGGYSVLSSMGVSAEDIENMSMDEFKGLMGAAMGRIPFDATRPYDEEIVNISDAGWENMKKDPDYAAWVLGYIKEDRSVRNPFFGMGDKGAYCTRNIGAGPSDYHGQMFSKIYGGTASGARAMFESGKTKNSLSYKASCADEQPPKDYDLWEKKRREKKRREKELLEEEIQAKYLQKQWIADSLITP